MQAPKEPDARADIRSHRFATTMADVTNFWRIDEEAAVEREKGIALLI